MGRILPDWRFRGGYKIRRYLRIYVSLIIIVM
jgi:hypothetical protein